MSKEAEYLCQELFSLIQCININNDTYMKQNKSNIFH